MTDLGHVHTGELPRGFTPRGRSLSASHPAAAMSTAVELVSGVKGTPACRPSRRRPRARAHFRQGVDHGGRASRVACPAIKVSQIGVDRSMKESSATIGWS